MQGLRMRALARHIKARLFTGLPFFMPTLDVEFDGEAVRVRGVVRLPRERALVMEKAGSGWTSAPEIRLEIQAVIDCLNGYGR